MIVESDKELRTLGYYWNNEAALVPEELVLRWFSHFVIAWRHTSLAPESLCFKSGV